MQGHLLSQHRGGEKKQRGKFDDAVSLFHGAKLEGATHQSSIVLQQWHTSGDCHLDVGPLIGYHICLSLAVLQSGDVKSFEVAASESTISS